MKKAKNPIGVATSFLVDCVNLSEADGHQSHGDDSHWVDSDPRIVEWSANEIVVQVGEKLVAFRATLRPTPAVKTATQP